MKFTQIYITICFLLVSFLLQFGNDKLLISNKIAYILTEILVVAFAYISGFLNSD